MPSPSFIHTTSSAAAVEGMDNNTHSLTVTCRFVPYDQWFVTHLDDKWKIKQVKHWILSKCNLIQASGPPNNRPVSPLTFASTTRTRSSYDRGNYVYYDDEDEDDDYEEYDDEGTDEFDESPYVQTETRRQPLYRSVSKHPSSDANASGTSESSAPPLDSPLTDQYTLVSFSSGFVLEDDFSISWYNLRPYELLEMHRSGTVVQLLREVVMDYVQPYFETKVRALRYMFNPRTGRFDVLGKDHSQGDMYSGVRERFGGRLDPFTSLPASPYNTKRISRAKVHWSERNVVVHQGVLTLFKDDQGSGSAQRYPLSALSALRGAESLARACSITADERVVCIKFKHLSNIGSPPTSTPSSPLAETGTWMPERTLSTRKSSDTGLESLRESVETDSEDYPTGYDTDDKAKRSRSGPQAIEDVCKSEGEWLVLDLLDDNAFSSILRILHRHLPHPISSSFLPPSSTLTLATPDQSSMSIPYPPSYDSLPYPEWRVGMVETAQKAGMGDVGKAMEMVLWAHRGVGHSLVSSIRRQRRAFIQYTPDVNTASTRSDRASETHAEESDDESELEWEGWVRDLDRQGRARKPESEDESYAQSSASLSQASSYRGVDMGSPSLYSSPSLSDAPHIDSAAQHLSALALSLAPSAFSQGKHYVPETSRRIRELEHTGHLQRRGSSPSSDGSTHPHIIRSMAIERLTTTTYSTVSVGPPPSRRRSSTVTMNTSGKDKKSKSKDTTVGGQGLRTIAAHVMPMMTVEQGENRGVGPGQTGYVRHARSGSNLRVYESGHSDIHSGPVSEGDVKSKKRREGLGIVRGMSIGAEKLVKGLDSALEFVDGKH